MRSVPTPNPQLIERLAAEADPSAAYGLLEVVPGVAGRVHTLRQAYGGDWTKIAAVLAAGQNARLDPATSVGTDAVSTVPAQREYVDSTDAEQLPADVWTPSGMLVPGQPERPDDIAELRHGPDAR